MSLAEVFYLTATVVLMIVGGVAFYIAYQIYKLKSFLEVAYWKLEKTGTFITTAKYSAQVGFFKLLLNLLNRKGGEKYEE